MSVLLRIQRRTDARAVLIARVGIGSIASGVMDGDALPCLTERQAEAAGMALADARDLPLMRD